MILSDLKEILEKIRIWVNGKYENIKSEYINDRVDIEEEKSESDEIKELQIDKEIKEPDVEDLKDEEPKDLTMSDDRAIWENNFEEDTDLETSVDDEDDDQNKDKPSDETKNDLTYKIEENTMINEYMINRRQRHTWHVVSNSPWPLCTALSAFATLWGFMAFLHYIPTAGWLVLLGFSIFLLCLFGWFRDVITEATYMGYHTFAVQRNLRFGFILFIVSEVMFFSSFFWAYFHCSLSPSIHVGGIWPPEGIVHFFMANEFRLSFRIKLMDCPEKIVSLISWSWYDLKAMRPRTKLVYLLAEHSHILFPEVQTEPNYLSFKLKAMQMLKLSLNTFGLTLNIYDSGVLMNPYKIPFLNTVILLTSGAVLTSSHMFLRSEEFDKAVTALGGTIVLAFYFIFCQYYEYTHATFSINDGIYGSTFFMLTGFHGFHVIVGTIFLIVCFGRFCFFHYTRTDHLSFESAIWYRHFVDVVWIILYFVVYLWPSVYFFKAYSFPSFELFTNIFSFNWTLVKLLGDMNAISCKVVGKADIIPYQVAMLDYPFSFIPSLKIINPELIKREFWHFTYASWLMFDFASLLYWYNIIEYSWLNNKNVWFIKRFLPMHLNLTFYGLFVAVLWMHETMYYIVMSYNGIYRISRYESPEI